MELKRLRPRINPNLIPPRLSLEELFSSSDIKFSSRRCRNQNGHGCPSSGWPSSVEACICIAQCDNQKNKTNGNEHPPPSTTPSPPIKASPTHHPNNNGDHPLTPPYILSTRQFVNIESYPKSSDEDDRALPRQRQISIADHALTIFSTQRRTTKTTS